MELLDRNNKAKERKNETLHPEVKPRSMNPLLNKPPVKIHPGMVPGKGKSKQVPGGGSFVGNEKAKKGRTNKNMAGL